MDDGARIRARANRLMRRITGERPVMATEWPVAAFSPRGTALLAKLGKHTIGKSCLYIKRLDRPTLEALVRASIRSVRALT